MFKLFLGAVLIGIIKVVALTFLLSLLVPTLITFSFYNVALVLAIYIVISFTVKFNVS
jgi:hypothetical protein